MKLFYVCLFFLVIYHEIQRVKLNNKIYEHLNMAKETVDNTMINFKKLVPSVNEDENKKQKNNTIKDRNGGD